MVKGVAELILKESQAVGEGIEGAEGLGSSGSATRDS